MDKKPRVLFLCTGNSARSQMAEAFLRRHGGERFEAHSAGLEPKPIHPYTYQVMAEAGYDLAGHRSKGLDEYLFKIHVGYLITVCADAEAHCPIYPGVGVREHWGLDDPAAFEGIEEEKIEFFRQVRDQIEGRVRVWLAEQEAWQAEP